MESLTGTLAEEVVGERCFTPRQFEVLNLLLSGKSVKEMGKGLYLAEAAMRNHARSSLRALGAHSRLEALVEARRTGLLTKTE